MAMAAAATVLRPPHSSHIAFATRFFLPNLLRSSKSLRFVAAMNTEGPAPEQGQWQGQGQAQGQGQGQGQGRGMGPRKGRDVYVPPNRRRAPAPEIIDYGPKAVVGQKIRVRGPLKVYHIRNVGEYDLGGLVGTVDQVGTGKEVTTFRVQFEIEHDGDKIQFNARLMDGEYDIVG